MLPVAVSLEMSPELTKWLISTCAFHVLNDVLPYEIVRLSIRMLSEDLTDWVIRVISISISELLTHTHGCGGLSSRTLLKRSVLKTHLYQTPFHLQPHNGEASAMLSVQWHLCDINCRGTCRYFCANGKIKCKYERVFLSVCFAIEGIDIRLGISGKMHINSHRLRSRSSVRVRTPLWTKCGGCSVDYSWWFSPSWSWNWTVVALEWIIKPGPPNPITSFKWNPSEGTSSSCLFTVLVTRSAKSQTWPFR